MSKETAIILAILFGYLIGLIHATLIAKGGC